MARQEGPGVPAPSMREPIGDFDVVSEDEWNAAREKLLAEEKVLMKAKDRLVAKRRSLPVTEVDRNYRFIGTNGDRDLLGLFEGRRQLVVYRFFYAPDVENWPDGACSGCSLFADTVVHPAHLAARDTTLAFVTAAPIDKIESLRERMGWSHLPFYSLPDELFSRDFGVEELFGINVFIRRDERMFRTYFLNGRGIEEIGPVWSFRYDTVRSAGDLAGGAARASSGRFLHVVASSRQLRPSRCSQPSATEGRRMSWASL
jgi:predicted dithiol-disulfide oxidoreductase (DUF899 family)